MISLLKKYFLSLFLFSLFIPGKFFAQEKMDYANFQVQEPGEVKFPTGVKKLVLANRSYQKTYFPDKNNYSYLSELQKMFLSAKTYNVEILEMNRELKNKNEKETLPPLDWNTVAQLLNNDTTAELIVLEQCSYIRYDYHYETKYGSYPGYSYKDNAGDSGGYSYKYLYTYQYFPNYPYFRFYSAPFVSSVGTGVKTGTQYLWRVYDLKSKTIIDTYEDRTTDNYYFINPITFPDNPEQYFLNYYLEDVSYAHHLFPHWINVSRDYYTNGNNEMEVAATLAVQGHVDSSAVIWKKLTQSTDLKIAGRACYNYAMTLEINGSLDAALAYAEQSKTDGDKNAPFYASTLRKRIAAKTLVDQQVNNGEGVLAAVPYYQRRY